MYKSSETVSLPLGLEEQRKEERFPARGRVRFASSNHEAMAQGTTNH